MSTSEKGSGFNTVAIIDDVFNPPVFGELEGEAREILSDPNHPETEAIINLMLDRGLIAESEGNEDLLDILQASNSLVRLLDLLEKERPADAEKFFSKYLADRKPLLELSGRLGAKCVSPDSISCIGPSQISELRTPPDLVFLDLVLWEDLDEDSLIKGVVDVLRRLSSATRSIPLFVVLMSERDSLLPKLAGSISEEAQLSINQFRFYPKPSLISEDSLALPLVFETLPRLRDVALAQNRLARSLEAALDLCKSSARLLILKMEEGDFKYLANNASKDNVDSGDYFAELIGAYVESELESAADFTEAISTCFNLWAGESGTPPAPHIASTKIVRELFVRVQQRLLVPGQQERVRPGAGGPATAGSEWQAWLRRFLPPGLVVGPRADQIQSGSTIYIHLTQDCDTLQERSPQSELSLLFVPAVVRELSEPLEESGSRVFNRLVRLGGTDWILRINLRKFITVSVEDAYDRLHSQWYSLALLRPQVADAIRRMLANQLNRPAEPNIKDQRHDWQLVELNVLIDSARSASSGPLAIPHMFIGDKGGFTVQLTHDAQVKITDILGQLRLSQLKGEEVISILTDIIRFKEKEVKSEDGTKKVAHILKLPINKGAMRKIEVELSFEMRRAVVVSFDEVCKS